MKRSLQTAMMLAVLGAAFATSDAEACAVCFGNPDSPMTKSMVAGIWLMLACIGTLLVSFASLFIYWMYRSYHLDLYREEGANN